MARSRAPTAQWTEFAVSLRRANARSKSAISLVICVITITFAGDPNGIFLARAESCNLTAEEMGGRLILTCISRKLDIPSGPATTQSLAGIDAWKNGVPKPREFSNDASRRWSSSSNDVTAGDLSTSRHVPHSICEFKTLRPPSQQLTPRHRSVSEPAIEYRRASPTPSLPGRPGSFPSQGQWP